MENEIELLKSKVNELTYDAENYKRKLIKITSEYYKVLDILNKDKQIEIGRTYFVTEWSWQPICEGRYVYEEIIREHAVIGGVDCYFTNKNNRVYFKEDIYTNIDEAMKVCSWQNSFSYDYEILISRESKIRELIEFEGFHWKYKNE